jgi:hypothetical protein
MGTDVSLLENAVARARESIDISSEREALSK